MMKKLSTTHLITLTVAAGLFGSFYSFAKLPDPTPEAKAASALTAAKTAHADKVSAFQLCSAQDRVAKKYATKPQSGEKAMETPACKDPGKFEPPAELVATVPAQTTPTTAVATAPVKK